MVDQRPIKIVRVIARLNVGGPAIHVTLLTERLAAPEFDSVLVAGRVPPTEGDMAYYAEQHGVAPLYLETMSREISPRNDWRTVRELIAILRREKPDVVHSHTAKAGLVARVAAWRAGVPVVVHTFHGHVLRGYFGPLKERVFRWLERFCARRSSVLLAVSEQVRQDLIDLGIAPAGKIRVMELGLELDRFARASRSGVLRAEFGIAPDAPLFGFCGRLTAIKSPDLLLTAFARVHAQRPDAHLVILGDGELRGEMERRVADERLAEVVHFAGFRQDLPPLVADLDAMVLTSRNEGTPVAVIEAAAGAVPSLCTAVGGVPDIVTHGETGWLVPAEDIEALTGAWLAAAADLPACAALGRRAQERVLTRFSADRLAGDMAALYREMLASRR
ncbi:MAG: glycosyltransferase family 4 protein [Armatimonadetes bacterium]|nr:glycosyltransferase family 4 protein [Armatimonadota bacterium]